MHDWSGGYNYFTLATSNTVLRCAGTATKATPDTTIYVGDGIDPPPFRLGSYSEGSATNWTAGYTKGTSTVTVASAAGYSVGDWVSLRNVGSGNVCPALWDNPINGLTETSTQTAHRAKITAISGASVTLDTPLRYDHSLCTGGTKQMFEITATRRVGLENCHIDGNGGNGSEYLSFVLFKGVESWGTGNKVTDADSSMVFVYDAARFLWSGNWIQNSNVDGYDSGSPLDLTRVSDALVENNIFQNIDEHMNIKAGAEATVVAYNYLLGPWQNKGVMLHGAVPRETLLEGNDIQVPFLTDNYWGRNGPATLFRNRFRDNRSGQPGDPGRLGIITQEFGMGPSNTQLTVVANFANWMIHNWALCQGSSYLDCLRSFDRNVQKAHIEKNVCYGQDDGSPTNDCIRFATLPGSEDVVNSDTSCGNGGTGAGDCAYNAAAQTLGDNKMGARVKPAGWSTDTIPVSLYRSAAPSWWCQEACPWSSAGIGAFGDNATGGFAGLCKLPAQILYEGGTCTPIGGVVTPLLDPPVLLDP
jgi:hypothetical protein